MGYVNFSTILSKKLIRITEEGNSQYYVQIMNKILWQLIQFSRLEYCYLKSVLNNSHDADEKQSYNLILQYKIYTNNKYFLIFICFNFFSYQEREDTLLIHAARLGKEDVVDLLLLAGARIEATNTVTKTVKLSQVMLTEYTCMHIFPFIY